MDALPPTLPFALARAYGSPAPAVAPTGRASVATAPVGPGAQNAPRTPSFADRLAAAVVPGKVNFDGPTPRHEAGTASASHALPFYRRPGDQNAAATSIAVGRTLDIKG